jgi:peptidoglycan/xylan/chitin deacetylase (PgdA/CDA1 family)
MYLIKTPFLLRAFYPNCVWKMPTNEKGIYLSFDDGPHPIATPFVLEQLDKYQAKASFFCIGKNVAEHPVIYEQIIAKGHTVGNHTQHHVNGWHTKDDMYLQNIHEASSLISSDFFRPPYGRIKRSQIKKIQANKNLPQQIIMWDVLSGDFDTKISGEVCLKNVLKHTKAGSIVVFHDSVKAWDRLKIALPATLEYFSQKGYHFKAL